MVPTSTPGATAPRLVFCTRSPARGSIDGAWWPGSTNLGAELPDVLAVIGSRIGEIRRVVYDPSLWPATPSRIIRRGVAIAVDPYTLVNRETIYLLGTHSRDAVLYVVPPSCAVTVVDRVLAAVSDAPGPMNAYVLRHLLGQFSAGQKQA